jgi:hypothetical protein
MAPLFFRLGCVVCALAALSAASFAQAIRPLPMADPTIPQSYNFYPYTFATYEPWMLYATTAFFFALGFMPKANETTGGNWLRALSSKNLPLLVAVLVLGFACVGRFAIAENFDLCIDEYLPEFQSRIFQHHDLVAEVPRNWIPYREALKLPYQIYHGTTREGYWASGFLPGFALLDFGFEQIDLGWALDPLLAALAIVLLAVLARRAFPADANLAAGIAVLLLACSPQFLIMALTKFSWTAHLCGTLAWIWLCTHPDRRLFLLTPILGVFLIGLHQPHVHFLVAAPFVLRLLYTGQWRALLWFGLWYGPGALAWYEVMVLLRPSAFGHGGELANLGFPFLLSLFITFCHAITFYAWATPLLVFLCGAALLNFRKQPALVQDSILAALITFFFYMGFPHFQGHGWGYRYLHPAYGCLALAGAAGAIGLYRKYPDFPLARALAASVLFSLAVQLPWRIHEVRAMVTPLARAWNFISTRPTDFVIVRGPEFWYACDLIRNDPWLQTRPLIFNEEYLAPGQEVRLSLQGSITYVGANEVRPFGVILKDPAKTPATSQVP